jgi:hypothetical protein
MTSRPRRRRGRIEPTGEWEQIELLCGCAEQRDYVVFPPFKKTRIDCGSQDYCRMLRADDANAEGHTRGIYEEGSRVGVRVAGRRDGRPELDLPIHSQST